MSNKVREYLEELTITRDLISNLASYIKAKKGESTNLQETKKNVVVASEELDNLHGLENRLENYINKNSTTNLGLVLSEYSRVSGIKPEDIRLSAKLGEDLDTDVSIEDFDISEYISSFRHLDIDFGLSAGDKRYYFKKKFQPTETLSDGSTMIENVVADYIDTEEGDRHIALYISNPERIDVSFRTRNFITFDEVMTEAVVSAIEEYSSEEPTA